MWTIDKVKEQASNYKTLKEFSSNKALASAASRLGIYKKVTKNLLRVNLAKPLTKEEALQRCKQFLTRTDCSINDYSAYSFLNDQEKDEIFGPAHSIKVKWTEELILKEAQKYKTINAFKKGSSGAYQAMLKDKKIKSLVYSILEPSKSRKFTFEELRKEALKYTTKQSFKLNSYGHYQAACRHENFKEICSHMIPGKIATNYDKPMWLYVVKIVTLDNSIPTVYKVGITKRSYILDRFWIDYVKSKTSIKVLFKHKYETGKEAHEMEQNLIKEFSNYAYTGTSPLIRTGTTEMFTVDITKVGIGLRDCNSLGEPKV